MNDNNINDNTQRDLEKSRREKVEKFKVNFGDDFFGNTVADDDFLGKTEISSESKSKVSDKNDDTLKNDSFFASNFDFFEGIESGSSLVIEDENDIASCSAEGVQHQYTKEELKAQNKALKLAKKAEKKRKKYKAKKNAHIFRLIWVLAVIVIGISIGKFGIIGANDFLAIDRTSTNTAFVKLPKDAKISEISDILEKNGVINSSFFFNLYATLTRATEGFHQGEFEIAKNKDYEAIIDFLQSDFNRKDIVTIQFSEGMTVEEIAKKLSDEQVCDYNEFLELCRSDVFDEDYDFIAEIDASKRYYKLEGYLFPDTYDFYIGEDAENTIRRFLANFKAKCITEKVKISGYDKRVNIRRQAELLGYTLDEIINLASFVQAESADLEDMYMVSSVFTNRLNTKDNGGYSPYNEYNLYLLQSDAAYFYMEKLPDAYKAFFDTETVGGLTGGPITNPGMAAIQAALYPKDTDYYYFCHKSATEDSPAEAFYASTFDVHNYNLQFITED